jgi:Mg2+/Co2+ transporter CorB
MAGLVDGLIIILLAATMAYGFVISWKVQRLMAMLKDLEPLVVAFSNAVDKSEESVESMRANLDGSATQQQAKMRETTAEESSLDEDKLTFASRRVHRQKMSGVQVVRDKKEMVRMFFEATRADARA